MKYPARTEQLPPMWKAVSTRPFVSRAERPYRQMKAMRNYDYQKPQYVDISYGWQRREELGGTQRRTRRWWRVVLYVMIGLSALAYAGWRLV